MRHQESKGQGHKTAEIVVVVAAAETVQHWENACIMNSSYGSKVKVNVKKKPEDITYR